VRPYQYICDTDRYHELVLPTSLYLDWRNTFDGCPAAEHWTPPPIAVYENRERGNFPYLAGNLPVFDASAWTVLRPLLEGHVEALPMPPPQPDWPALFAINVTTVLDCLDEAASDLDRFDDLILRIGHHAFCEEQIRDIPIFRIQGYALTAVYVSPAFRALVDARGLRGLLWRELP
jgi:hypothetical protein